MASGGHAWPRAFSTALSVGLLAVVTAPCAQWCNAHTCEKDDCNSCETQAEHHCQLVAAGKHCEGYCNAYTCADRKCHGCAACAEAKEAAKEAKAEKLGGTDAAPVAAKAHTRASSGFGCCADKEASSCDACRYWANGGFCAQHAVNCQTCGFSVFCEDPSRLPPPAPPAPPPAPPIDLRCERGRLVDCRGGGACGDFVLRGVSWFGMEEKYAMLQGLEKVRMASLLDLVAGHGFNAVRIPLAVTSVLADPLTSQFGGMIGQINPGLHERHYLQVLDVLVREASKRGLLVLLDMHRLSAGDRNNPLWHDAAVGEEQLLGAWQILASRYCESAWNVVGADIFNEPWAASWGHGPPGEDWAAAAERVGSRVSHACARWLILIEGVSHTDSHDEPAAGATQSPLGHNWAANLEGMRDRPIKLTPERGKLVLSPHVYGPSVAPQPYFDEPDFPRNLEAIWDTFFGFVASSGSGCLVIGEWGGWMSGSDALWQKAFSAYLTHRRISHFYWALNPTSRDTGGLVLADWSSPSTNKLTMLDAMPATPVLPGSSALVGGELAHVHAGGGGKHPHDATPVHASHHVA